MYDFRSDTVTLPTEKMMAAIAVAELGDAARGDDPTVRELETLCREITGKEDALFLPSGAMANLAAIFAHECQGGEVIVESRSHIYNSEGGALSVCGGAVARPIDGDFGVMPLDKIRAAIRGSANLALAPTRLICVENTHNDSGGSVLSFDQMEGLRSIAHEHGLPLHLDGARLFNAATFLETEIRPICDLVDTVWFALCKGLGAPVGAILAGDGEVMQRARRAAKMLGGGMRQAGIIAAPAIIALRDPYTQHRTDHALANRLARGLNDLNETLVDVGRVNTNIVNCYVDHFASDAQDIRDRLAEHGVLTLNKGTKIRFVTHSQVNENAVDAAVAAFSDVLSEQQASAV